MIPNSKSSNFVHRHNRNGRSDSICTRCYQTIAKEREENDLNAFEEAHVCAGWLNHAVQTIPDTLQRFGVLENTSTPTRQQR
jgi:hypothetical protein